LKHGKSGKEPPPESWEKERDESKAVKSANLNSEIIRDKTDIVIFSKQQTSSVGVADFSK